MNHIKRVRLVVRKDILRQLTNAEQDAVRGCRQADSAAAVCPRACPTDSMTTL
jgi:hypothetical protein